MFDNDLIKKIRAHLLSAKETIAIAESVTSGYLQAAIGSAEDASQFFQGGITTYNVGQKYRHLGVEPIHAIACDCVSEKTAIEMALNVCNLFCSNWGISITGYAALAPENEVDALFAWYAIAYNGNICTTDKLTVNEHEPLKVQLLYVHKILRGLELLLSTS